MAFAKGTDHLDGDHTTLAQFVVPRLNASAIYRVKDGRLVEVAVIAGDVVVIERDQPLRSGRIALVRVGGSTRLLRVVRSGIAFTFGGLPDQDEPIDVIGIASRVVRALIWTALLPRSVRQHRERAHRAPRILPARRAYKAQ